MIRTTNNLKTIDEDRWIKYINKVYFNNNGMKTVKSHSKFIIDIDDNIYDEFYTTEMYYGNILVYCCKYESRNGGKLQKVWEEEYVYDQNDNLLYSNTNSFKEWYDYDQNNHRIHYLNSKGFEYWKYYNSKGRLIYKKDSRGGESFYKYAKNKLLYIKNIDGRGRIKYEKIYNLKEAK